MKSFTLRETYFLIDLDDFDNGWTHSIGAIAHGSQELMCMEALNDELTSRRISMLKYMPHTLQTYEMIVQESNSIFFVNVNEPMFRKISGPRLIFLN